jgi:hypothetical protein
MLVRLGSWLRTLWPGLTVRAQRQPLRKATCRAFAVVLVVSGKPAAFGLPAY